MGFQRLPTVKEVEVVETVVDTGKTLQMEAVTNFPEILGMDAELPTQEQVLTGEREPR